MTKAKAKKRFVLGEGYPWKHIDTNGESIYLSKECQYPDQRILLFWPAPLTGDVRYRLVLEEI